MANPSRRPVNAETRARAVALMEQGKTRNAIARELEISGGTVSRIAEDVGHKFDRYQTEVALAAITIDLAKDRGVLAKMMLAEAMRSLEDMHNPAVMVQFENGHLTEEFNEDGILMRRTHTPGVFREHVLDEPTFSDKRNLMTIAGIAVTKVAELTRQTDAAGSTEAVSFVDGLIALLQKATDTPVFADDASTDPTVESPQTTREALLAELEAESADDTPSE